MLVRSYAHRQLHPPRRGNRSYRNLLLNRVHPLRRLVSRRAVLVDLLLRLSKPLLRLANPGIETRNIEFGSAERVVQR